MRACGGQRTSFMKTAHVLFNSPALSQLLSLSALLTVPKVSATSARRLKQSRREKSAAATTAKTSSSPEDRWRVPMLSLIVTVSCDLAPKLPLLMTRETTSESSVALLFEATDAQIMPSLSLPTPM